MNRLTEDEILSYLCAPDKATGVHGITRERLEALDLDSVPEVASVAGSKMTVTNGLQYTFDGFTPRAGSYAFKPSYGGSQLVLAREGRKVIFSNGRWFSC